MGINAIIRVTETCNLGCNYCYAARSSPLDQMPDAVVTKLVTELAHLDVDDVKFIWHGGEPLLVAYGFYETVLKLQKSAFNNHRRFRNIIQTNGTTLTSKSVSFLQANNFGIGVSIDGPRSVHNANRPYLNGAPSFDDTWRGIEILLERGIDFGVLAVVTKNSLPQAEDIFDFFVSHRIKTFGFIPYLEFESRKLRPLAINAREYGKFLNTIFLKWTALDDPALKISNLSDCLDGLLGKRPYKCEASGTCLRCFFAVNQAGDIFPCSRFVGEKGFRYGNILEQPLADLLDGSVNQVVQQKRLDAIAKQCQSCRWFNACHGGCLHYRYEMRENIEDPYYFCGSKKKLYELMSRWLKEKLPEVLPVREWSRLLPGNLVNNESDGGVKNEQKTHRR